MAKPATATKTATPIKPVTPAKGATVTELKPDDAPPQKKRSWLKWVVIAIVVVAIAGGGAWYALRPAPAAAEPAPSKTAAPKAPVFLNLEPFTVNLMEENGDHYLQVGIVYQMADDKAVDQAKVYTPVLRNRVLLLLSSKHPSEIATLEGKNKLVAELISAARESVPSGPPDRGVVGAYLSAFVIQ